MKLKYCHNHRDYHALAKRRLPSPIFDYIDGGADDEVTLKNNSKAFDQYDFVPHILTGNDKIDLSCDVLGSCLSMPFFLSPTGAQCMYTPAGELASAKAANYKAVCLTVDTTCASNRERDFNNSAAGDRDCFLNFISPARETRANGAQSGELHTPL